MTKRLTTLLGALCAAGLVHCTSSAPTSRESTRPDVTSDEALEPMTSGYPSDRCVAEIERPIPADLVLKLGTPITLKTGGAICPVGIDEKLAYRYYVEKVDRNGNIISARKSPQGPTEWSLTKSPFDTSVLDGPGRYRIYGFSLPRTMIAAWQAGDQAAKNRSTRTGNAYVEFVTTSWGSGAPLACSVTCGGGTQTVPAACKDNNGVTRADSWCEGAKPSDTTQGCNAQVCPMPSNTIVFNGTDTFVMTNASAPNTQPADEDQCMMMGRCDPTSTYHVRGEWGGGSWALLVFASKPTAEGEYTVTYDMTPSATFVHVDIFRSFGQSSWHDYIESPSDAVVKVRMGTDGKLHAQLTDSYFGSPAQHAGIELDLAVEP